MSLTTLPLPSGWTADPPSAEAVYIRPNMQPQYDQGSEKPWWVSRTEEDWLVSLCLIPQAPWYVLP